MDDDIDDILDSIFQVIDLQDPRLKDKLRRGLERGLEVASELGQDVKVELDLEAESPEVVVLDGGKTDGADPPTPTERPDLSVVDRDADDDFDAYEDDFDLDGEDDFRVRVLGSRYRHETLGRIEVDDDVQTVFRGAEARLYRIHCDDGALRVMLEGMAVDAITGGQSIDVEAALIQVRGDGEGTYLALRR